MSFKLEKILNYDCDLFDTTSLLSRPLLGRGGYGEVRELDKDRIVKIGTRLVENYSLADETDCLTNRGCKSDILMEGLILSILDSLDCRHIPHFYGLYKCDNIYYLVMERIYGDTFTDCNYDLSLEQRLVVLFQLTYALYMANSHFRFVHGDLIGKNIMIADADNEYDEYNIDGKLVRIRNFGIRLYMIDFGFSRLSYQDHDEKVVIFQSGREIVDEPIRKLMSPEYMFDGRADLCKIYANPNFRRGLDFKKVVMRSGQTLDEVISRCVTFGKYYVSVPPFPKLDYLELLFSSLFDPIKTSN